MYDKPVIKPPEIKNKGENYMNYEQRGTEGG